jgi:hypothetical protein
MWQYISYSLDSVNIAGNYIIRVFMQKDLVDECFFLEYRIVPDESVVISDAQQFIEIRNNYEQQIIIE